MSPITGKGGTPRYSRFRAHESVQPSLADRGAIRRRSRSLLNSPDSREGAIVLFRRRSQYDRTRFLREAREELRNKKFRRALLLLRQLLAREPNNPELHALIAAPLAERGFAFDAWASYQAAAAALCTLGKKQAALALYADATRRLPHCFDAWVARASLERELGRPETARGVLLEGRDRFNQRRFRSEAIALLQRALEIDPGSLEVIFDLARLLMRVGRKEEALFQLDRLAGQTRGKHLKAIYRVKCFLSPSLANSWRWLRAGSS